MRPLVDIAAEIGVGKGEVAPIGGAVGRLVDVPLSAMVIDERFQRRIRADGITLIRRIAEDFDWTKFTPIIVALTDDGRYSIIDGQHRAVAALKRGDIAKLPCWVVDVDLKGQSRAFIAINGERTRMHSCAVWYAKHAAGDPDALHLFDLCGRAKVAMARYPMSQATRPPRTTMAGADIMMCAKSFGDTPVVRALRWLADAGEIAEESMLTRRFIRAACRAAIDRTLSDAAAVEVLSLIEPAQFLNAVDLSARASGRDSVVEAAERLVKGIRRAGQKVAA